jgi:hypothetical protein
MGQPTDGYKVCDNCGSLFLHFCLHCSKMGIEERVFEIMDRYSLNEDNLIKMLSEHINEGSFPALSLAITLREMRPSTKSEVAVTDRTEIRDAKERLGALMDKMVKAKSAK